MPSNVWMLRNDGLEIAMENSSEYAAHIYGCADEFKGQITLEDIFLASFLEEYDKYWEPVNNYYKALIKHLKNNESEIKKYFNAPRLFYNKPNHYLLELIEKYIDKTLAVDLKDAQAELNDDLNQTFCRVRLGGRYISKNNNKDIYFRISSVGYDWQHVIAEFVNRHLNEIETVTIERDRASTGSEMVYQFLAANASKEAIDKMPVNDFLSKAKKESPLFEEQTMNQCITEARDMCWMQDCVREKRLAF